MNIVSQKKRAKRRILEDGGIYSITCTANNKVYIGSTVNFKQRWGQHRSKLNKDEHHSPHLQRAYNKYGLESFNFQVVEYIKYADELLESEQRWIYWYQSHDRIKGFNVCSIAGSTTGRERNDKEKIQISNGLRQFYTKRRNLKEGEQVFLNKIDFDSVFTEDGISLELLLIRDLKKIASIYGINRYSVMTKDSLIRNIVDHPQFNSIHTILSVNQEESSSPCLRFPTRRSKQGKKIFEDHKCSIAKKKKPSLIFKRKEYNIIIENGLEAINLLSIRSLKLAARFYDINAYSYMTKDELICNIKKCPEAIDINAHAIQSK